MIERIKRYKVLRRRDPHVKLECPVCKVKMKRKGKKGTGNEYFRCPKCRGKMRRNGSFAEPPNPETLDIREHQIKEFHKEMSKRKLVIKMKQQKYLGLKTFEWEGQIINLADYDVDGITFEEKKKIEEELKKQAEKAKKEENKRKRSEAKKAKVTMDVKK